MPTFYQRIQSALKAFSQNTSPEYNRAVYSYIGNGNISNNENDDNYIRKGYQKNPTIYSLINLITKTAVAVPFIIYEKKDEDALKQYKALTSGIVNDDSLIKANMIKKHALIKTEHTPLHDILDRPNPAQSYATFMTEVIAFGKLTGNRFIYGIGPDTREGKVFNELYALPSHLVEIKSNGIFEPVSKYCMSYGRNQYDIEADDVLHIADFNPDYDGSGSHLYGQSPLLSGLRSMTSNNEAVETGLKYLQNQTARGILTSEDESLTPTQAQQLKDAFRRNYQGSHNAGDVIVTPKKLSWTNFGLSAGDLQLLETYNASIKDLCNIFSVPAVLLNNMESSTYNNMREAKKALYQNCVIPELDKLRDELNRWLVPLYGENLFLDFDYNSISELQQEQEKIVSQLSQSYWLSNNEKRMAMGYGLDEEKEIMNDFLVPSNLIPISDLDLGSEKNFFESAVVEKQEMNERLRKALKKKADDHNESVTSKTKKTNVRTLFAVYKRGVGAYRTNPESVRPTVNSEQQWAMARVNSYIYALKNGKFRGGKHDTDLFPEGHPLSSKGKSIDLNHKKLVPGMTDVFTTQQEAEERARELGGSGSHSHSWDGEQVFMPFESHDEYNEAVSNEKTHYDDDEEERRRRRRNKDLSDEHYDTPDEAMERARQIGCSLTHSHNTEDGTVYMPCRDMDELEQALGTEKQETYGGYPKKAIANAERAIKVNDKYNNPCATAVGKQRAQDIVSNRSFSLSVLKRVFSYLSRAKEYNTGTYEKDDKPVCGTISYNLWGGDAMLNWSERKLKQIEE
tara:strand:+ start:6541 stop:8928 length:2388 start_codon:yes stop_codon:yes gene_type:complete